MRLMHAPTLQAFYDRVAPFLQEREAEHNMMLAHISDALRQPPDEPPAHEYLGYVESEAGEVVAAAHFGGRGLSIAHPQAGYEAAFEVLVKDAASPLIHDLRVPVEFGAVTQAIWQAQTGQRLTEDFPARIYRLDTVIPVQGVAGAMRWATADDGALMRDWMIAFEMEAFDASPAQINVERLTRWLARFTASGVYQMALWIVDDTPVCMAATVRRSPTGMRIGLVYTPPEQRGHGYASALTAALSQHLLDSGLAFCTLNTDIDNPTSNKIYQAIGYYPVADQMMYEVEGQ